MQRKECYVRIIGILSQDGALIHHTQSPILLRQPPSQEVCMAAHRCVWPDGSLGCNRRGPCTRDWTRATCDNCADDWSASVQLFNTPTGAQNLQPESSRSPTGPKVYHAGGGEQFNHFEEVSPTRSRMEPTQFSPPRKRFPKSS